MDLNILPECYVDTKLTTILVPPTGHYNHQKGTHVLKRMEEKLMNEFALGIVDEDFEDRSLDSFMTFLAVFNCYVTLIGRISSSYGAPEWKRG